MEIKDGITIKVGVTVDSETAEVCLKLVEMYINKNGYDVDILKRENGKIELNLIPRY